MTGGRDFCLSNPANGIGSAYLISDSIRKPSPYPPMIRSFLFYSSVLFASVGSLSAAIVGHTFTGKTNLYTITGFENEYPLGSEYELRVEWDDTAVGEVYNENQAGYPLTKFTLTIKGKSGNWTSSSLPGKASFSLNRIEGFPDEIQFTSGWGPENHTNGTIPGGQTYSINLVLGDPTATALSTLSPIPSAIDPAIWSADENESYLKFYVTEMGGAIFGDVNGLGVSSEPSAPEIAVQELKGKDLIGGKSTIRYASVKKGKTGEAKIFVIQNTGKKTLKGLALDVGGKHKKDFIDSGLSKKSLAPGAKATFKVSFRPKAVGKRKAVVKIESNDADENPFEITLLGTGK